MRLRTKVITGVVPAAIIALLVATSQDAFTEEPAPPQSEAAATLRVDYETGTQNSGHAKLGYNECCAHSLDVVELARTGDHAIRSQLRYGDPMVVNGTRAESHTDQMPVGDFNPGDSLYYGFSVYIVSTWQTDSTEDIVFQWHNWPDACEPSKFPTAFLSVQPTGKWRLRVNSDGNACSTPESLKKTSFDLADVKPGQWNDFVFKFDWSYGDQGRIQGWHQTSKAPGWQNVLDATGPNTFNDGPGSRGYLKWGIYKPAWNKAPTKVSSRVLVHDNISIGTSFTSVDPSLGG